MPPRRKSEIWNRPVLVRAIAREQRRIVGVLEARRHELGCTQEKAAEHIGVHEKALARMERGEAIVTLASLVAVTRAYRIDLAALFAGSA